MAISFSVPSSVSLSLLLLSLFVLSTASVFGPNAEPIDPDQLDRQNRVVNSLSFDELEYAVQYALINYDYNPNNCDHSLTDSKGAVIGLVKQIESVGSQVVADLNDGRRVRWVMGSEEVIVMHPVNHQFPMQANHCGVASLECRLREAAAIVLLLCIMLAVLKGIATACS